ncbi:hypothetical protein H5S09_04585 [Limosilactobacillus sp. STM2_1]|uniref:Uncharacterized protein n=1 Tax=Limosilactobacillus rudii TaxID=2759755 RepID=A0A7W3UKJ8_9LACO|nr:hypothetical protein [Limosilactobacillus rudii]MBB1078569.1 hypothetical protein [Limosilactobacillus rudii]MBB1097209.1 hypothetical protein [Limosilactobacillus rudii]MCD7133875.1 hypothetical protein [Limosilactobacillus rudii]
MNSLITFIISIVFLGLVIWENRLHSQLGFLASQFPEKVTKDFIKVVRQERWLNWVLCILAIIVFLTTSRYSILIISIITIIELLLVMRMDRIKNEMIE